MAVRIRLSRIGKKHIPFFRIVAVDSRRKRNSAVLANIGTYDVLNGKVIRFHEELYQEWISKGALPTDSAKKIYQLFKKGAAAPEKVSEVKAVKPQKEKVAGKKTSAKKESVEVAQEKKVAAKKEVKKATEAAAPEKTPAKKEKTS